jgi:hypothetical protein
MPVNMDPTKKRRRTPDLKPDSALPGITRSQKAAFGEETEDDRIKALADAENKNLWDATEVIDMDNF